MTGLPASESGAIVVETSRRWLGVPSLGGFLITVDGVRAGLLLPQSSLRISCTAGEHRVRAWQWWYTGRSVLVTVGPGETVELAVDLDRSGSFPIQMLRLMFTPWRGVSIAEPAGDR